MCICYPSFLFNSSYTLHAYCNYTGILKYSKLIVVILKLCFLYIMHKKETYTSFRCNFRIGLSRNVTGRIQIFLDNNILPNEHIGGG